MDYNKIIKRSWEVTWKNKWLWVPALALAAFSGGRSLNSGGGSSSSSNTDPSSSPIPIPQDIEGLKNTTSYVLGESINRLGSWFSSVPPQNWMYLVLVSGVSILMVTIFIWILTSWAKSTLIHGFEEANKEKTVTLSSISPVGVVNIKKLIIFNLITMGIGLAFALVSAMAVGLGYVLYSFLGVVVTVLYSVLVAIGFILCTIILIMISIYAERLIVLNNISPWEAWKKGLTLSKGNFGSTLWMSIVNSTIGCITGCLSTVALLLIFAIPGFLLIYPIFKDGFVMPSLGQIISIILMASIFMSLNLLVRAILVVFNYGNWNLFFTEVVNKKNE